MSELLLDLAKDDRPYKTRLKEAVRKVSPEQVQEIKRLFLGGDPEVKTVGDIARRMRFELMIVSQIICNNIETVKHHRLSEEWT